MPTAIAVNPLIERLNAQRAGQVDFIEQLVQRAADEERDLVETERRSIDSASETITAIDEQIKPLVAFENVRNSAVVIDARLQNRAATRTTPRAAEPFGEFQGFGDRYIDSPEFQSRGIQARSTIDDIQGFRLAMESRAVLTTLVDPGKSFLPQPQQYTPQTPAFKTPLLDAVTRVPVTTGSVELLSWGEVTGFDVVAEGAEKPELAVVNGSVNVPLEVVAGWIQYTRQLAQDSEAFRVLLNSGLTRGLLRELEEKIAAAITGATLPSFTGAAGVPLIEVVRVAMAKVQAAGFTPTHVMSSPENMAQLDINVLNLGGAAGTVLGNGLWSLIPVPVNGMTETIVSDAAAAFALFERTGIEIYTTDSDITGSGSTAKSGFRQNILTTLAETRAKGAVLNPNAACEAITVAGAGAVAAAPAKK
jgi:HK97 family phage major capsid protein